MIVTRFNPSVNGPLHLGHVYMALINEAFAKDGRFLVRWDDSHPIRIRTMGRERIENILRGQREDLAWLGFKPYAQLKQSDVIDLVEKVSTYPLPEMEDEEPVMFPILIGSGHVPLYPLTPVLTFQKVVMDRVMGVTHLIRGVDLMTEYSLYQYFCRCLNYPQPRHIYLPRLRWEHGDMSKTAGAMLVCVMRKEGYTPEEVRDIVARACLHTPSNGWTFENIKGNPCL